jgi:hypothetical protein
VTASAPSDSRGNNLQLPLAGLVGVRLFCFRAEMLVGLRFALGLILGSVNAIGASPD